jgi:hypothetical protein
MSKASPPEVPVRFYRSETGKEPVREWLRGLDDGDRKAIGLDLMRVQFGWPIGMPLAAKSEGRTLGGAFFPAQPADRKVGAVLSRQHIGCPARIHQKDAEDPG